MFQIIRVSSVLNRNTKAFGKQHLFDGSDETCWNSDNVSKVIKLDKRSPIFYSRFVSFNVNITNIPFSNIIS